VGVEKEILEKILQAFQEHRCHGAMLRPYVLRLSEAEVTDLVRQISDAFPAAETAA